jgi:hypothetical protein
MITGYNKTPFFVSFFPQMGRQGGEGGVALIFSLNDATSSAVFSQIVQSYFITSTISGRRFTAHHRGFTHGCTQNCAAANGIAWQ